MPASRVVNIRRSVCTTTLTGSEDLLSTCARYLGCLSFAFAPPFQKNIFQVRGKRRARDTYCHFDHAFVVSQQFVCGYCDHCAGDSPKLQKSAAGSACSRRLMCHSPPLPTGNVAHAIGRRNGLSTDARLVLRIKKRWKGRLCFMICGRTMPHDGNDSPRRRRSAAKVRDLRPHVPPDPPPHYARLLYRHQLRRSS